MKKVPEGYIRMGDVMFSPEEVQFYQHLADDKNIITASELVLVPKRTCEDRLYKLQAHLGINTKHGLIMHLARKKIVK